MPARIVREESEAAAAFDQRGEIGFAILSPKKSEDGLPNVRICCDPQFPAVVRRSC
jgi:hypothetical protein